MSRQTVDPQTREQALAAMNHLAEFETVERYAIRHVFEAAKAGAAVDDAHLEFARVALAKRVLN